MEPFRSPRPRARSRRRGTARTDPRAPARRPGPARRAVLRALAELPERSTVELVRLPELVQQPDDLVRMPDRIRRELGRDRQVDPPAVRLLEIEQAPEERLAQDAFARIPLVWDGHEGDVVLTRAQFGDEIVGEYLRPAALERHLRRA